MAIYGYTKNYKLIKPQFNTDTWHDYIYDNLDTIDAVMSAIYASGNWKGFWATNTAYTVDDVVIDQSTDTMYKVLVSHTTSEATFAEEDVAHPTYYEKWSPNDLAESWAIKMDGVVDYTDYSSKAYAVSSGLIDNGSAKEWAIKSGTIGTTGEYSAKKYATDAHNDYISMTTNVNVIAVGSNIASVNAVAGISSAVSTVANKITEVDTVAGISTDVTTVAGIATAVSNVSNIESSVLDVSDNRTDISTVASNINNVNNVGSNIANVNNVSTNMANVLAVKNNATNINAVAGNATNINAVNANKTNINTVAGNSSNVTTVATNISNVNAVAGDLTNINAVAADLANIDSASTYATNANVWAEGTDEQVQALGGTHSAKVWADVTSGANKDLSNLTSAGEAHFANPALTNSSYTTNRILEIPRDIKLELNNGTLTLKAGSKVYVPNGSGTFDTVTISNDISVSSSSDRNCLYFLNSSHTGIERYPLNICFSGNNAPSGNTNLMWYDTNTNLIKKTTNSGSTWSSGISLPFAVIHEGSSGITSIDQVFNGFGYIGSTVFVLPNVKVQIPNGRNADGTCNSNIATNNGVKLLTLSSSVYGNKSWYVSSSFTISATDAWVFNYEKNCYINSEGNPRYVVEIGSGLVTSGKTSSFASSHVDSVVNSNEFYQLKDNAVTLTDNQTISGTKTFTATPTINGGNGAGILTLKNNVTTYGTSAVDLLATTSNSKNQFHIHFQEGNKWVGYWTQDPTTKNVTCNLQGCSECYAPHPSSATDNSAKIATTAWVRNHCCTTAATTSSTASYDAPAYVVENYKSGSNWYRVWSDGWIEQGGYLSSTPPSYTGVTVTFLKPFSDTNYFSSPSWGSATYGAVTVGSRTTTGMNIINRTNDTTDCYWYACGY